MEKANISAAVARVGSATVQESVTTQEINGIEATELESLKGANSNIQEQIDAANEALRNKGSIAIDDMTIKKDEQNKLSVPALDRVFRAKMQILTGSCAVLDLTSQSDLLPGDLFLVDIFAQYSEYFGTATRCTPKNFAIMLPNDDERVVIEPSCLIPSDDDGWVKTDDGSYGAVSIAGQSGYVVTTWEFDVIEPSSLHMVVYTGSGYIDKSYTLIDFGSDDVVKMMVTGASTGEDIHCLSRCYDQPGHYSLTATYYYENGNGGPYKHRILFLPCRAVATKLYSSQTISIGTTDKRGRDLVPTISTLGDASSFTILRYNENGKFHDLMTPMIYYDSNVNYGKMVVDGAGSTHANDILPVSDILKIVRKSLYELATGYTWADSSAAVYYGDIYFSSDTTLLVAYGGSETADSSDNPPDYYIVRMMVYKWSTRDDNAGATYVGVNLASSGSTARATIKVTASTADEPFGYCFGIGCPKSSWVRWRLFRLMD